MMYVVRETRFYWRCLMPDVVNNVAILDLSDDLLSSDFFLAVHDIDWIHFRSVETAA